MSVPRVIIGPARRRVLAAVAALALLAGLGTAAGAASRLPAAPAVVVVVPDAISEADAASELYGDWQSFLGDFAATETAAVTVLTASEYSDAAASPTLGAGVSTLFLRPDGQALLFPGMALEPDVYIVGAGWTKGTATLREAGRWGLVPIPLVPRAGR